MGNLQEIEEALAYFQKLDLGPIWHTALLGLCNAATIALWHSHFDC
jgi:hypothetical protein